MTPPLRLLLTVSSLILVLVALPLAAQQSSVQGTLTATRSPGGEVPAGSTITITATIENPDPDNEFQNFSLGSSFAPVRNPYLTLVPGTVTSRWREQDIAFGNIVSGNDPGDETINIEYDFLPSEHHIDVTWEIRVASRLPDGVEEDLAQIFLNTSTSSTPFYMTIPIFAEPNLRLGKSDFDRTFSPGGSSVTYNLVPRNVGSQEATGLVLTDTIPDHTSFNPAASHPDWSCAPHTGPGSVCTLTFDSLPAGDLESFGFTLVFHPDAVPAGLEAVRNTARLRDDGTNTEGSDTPKQALAFETTPVVAAPDLSVAKSDGGASTSPNEPLAYQLSYRNHGSQDATGVELRETVPEHTTFDAGASTTGWSCSPATGPPGATCVLAAGDLPVGASGTATFALRVDPSLPQGVDTITNTASIRDDGRGGADLDSSDNVASDTTPLLATPDLTVSKTDGGATAHPAASVQYRLSYQNRGDQAATGVTLEETVPQHTRFAPGASSSGWTCSPDDSAGSTCTLQVGSLASGASGATDFALAVLPTVPAGVDQLLNTVRVFDDGANGSDPTPGNNTATEPTPLDAAPDLAVTKSDAGASARPGQTVVYSLDYDNLGEQGATMVTLEETVPDHASFDAAGSDAGWTCQPTAGPSGASCLLSIGPLEAGAGGTAKFVVQVNSSVPAGIERLDNEILILDDGENGDDLNPVNNTDTEPTPLDAAPDLTLTKADGDQTVRPGEVLVYTLSWDNAGDQAASGVELAETVPDHTSFSADASDAGWSCSPTAGPAGSPCTFTVGEVAAGATGSTRFAVVVDEALPADVEQLVNRALVRDDEGTDPDDEVEEPTPVDASPDLMVTKSDGDQTTRPGEVLVYTLSWDNAGDQAAAGVELVETVPDHTSFSADASAAGWSCTPVAGPAGSPCTFTVGEVAAGATGSTRFAVVVDEALPADIEQLVNRAVVRDDEGTDPDDEVEEPTPVDAAPALSITKADGGVTADPGATLVYTLGWTNAGDQAARGVELAETVPDHTSFSADASDAGWSCSPAAGPAGAPCTFTVGELAAGASGSTRFAVVVDETLPAEIDRLVNRAVVRDDEGADPDDEVEEPTPVDAVPDLSVTKSDGDVQARPGETLVYTLDYRNGGAQSASGATLQETLPSNTRFDSAASSDGWTCLADAPSDARICSLSLGTLEPGDSGSVQFAVRLGSSLPSSVEHIDNVVEIFDDGAQGDDADLSDNIAREQTPVLHAPSGSEPALDVFLRDSLAEDRDGSGSATSGDVLTYAVRVQHTGGEDARELTWEVPIPDYTSYVSGSLFGDTVRTSSLTPNLLRAELADLPAGQSAAFVFDVEVGQVPDDVSRLRAQGTISALDVSSHPSDDPDTAAPDDPTLTPLRSAGGPGAPVDVPTASTLGLILLGMLLAAAAWSVLR